MLAANNNHERIVSLLLDRGADINSKDNGGSTALMWAAVRNYERIVSLLLDRGVDVHSKINNGWTVLDIAERNKFSNIISMIQNKLEIEAPVNIYFIISS